MNIEAFVNKKIEASGLSRVQINNKLDMTDRGVRLMLKKETVTVKKYLEMASILSFDPCEYFHTLKESDTINMVSEPRVEYRAIKNDEFTLNELLKQNSELIKQNRVLVDVIDRLTKPSK